MKGIRPLQFWFEFSSPYSALASHELYFMTLKGTLPTDIIIQPKVFLLGGLLKEINIPGLPFQNNPRRFEYMWVEVERQSTQLQDKYGLVNGEEFPIIKRPATFPLNSILAVRITSVLQTKLSESSEENNLKLLRFISKVYFTGFSKDQDISDKNILKGLLTSIVPEFDAEEILQAAISNQNKRFLKEQTSFGEKQGLFGAPSFITHNKQLYWGADRLYEAIKTSSALNGKL